MAKEVIVKILNRDYFLEDDGDPLFLNALGKYVEEKMIEVSETRKIVDTSKIAVMASILLCKELFEMKAKVEKIDKSLDLLNSDLSKKIENLKK